MWGKNFPVNGGLASDIAGLWLLYYQGSKTFQESLGPLKCVQGKEGAAPLLLWSFSPKTGSWLQCIAFLGYGEACRVVHGLLTTSAGPAWPQISLKNSPFFWGPAWLQEHQHRFQRCPLKGQALGFPSCGIVIHQFGNLWSIWFTTLKTVCVLSTQTYPVTGDTKHNWVLISYKIF